MGRLDGKICLVTGGSRGVGKGIALALGSEGATVYVTGRSSKAKPGGLPGTVETTAHEVTSRGGRGIAVVCDHAVDEQVHALFATINSSSGGLDVLVNNAFAIPTGPMFDTPFWEQPIAMWDSMHSVGLRSHYVASVLAVPLMQAGGLIANISSFGGASYQLNVAYGVGKAGVDRLSRDMARDLEPRQIASVALYPGIVRTEWVLANRHTLPWDLSVSESPEFTGRAVAHLAADPHLLQRNGRVCVVAELAREYGFTDVDGKLPPSLRSER